MLVILVGMIAMLLNSPNSEGLKEDTVVLGTYLVIPLTDKITGQEPLMQLTQLIGFTLLNTLSPFVFGCTDDRLMRGNQIVKGLHGRILKQSLRRAEVEGAAAQQVRADEIIGVQLPCIQNGLSQWYQLFLALC